MPLIDLVVFKFILLRAAIHFLSPTHIARLQVSVLPEFSKLCNSSQIHTFPDVATAPHGGDRTARGIVIASK